MADSIFEKILQLKKAKHAVLLSHNYQLPEIQDAADFVGDSLGLSQEASRVTADLIVFCGVHFMAETAKLLNPSKRVLMPDPRAGCPMADMIDGAQLQDLKRKHPGAKVVCYINSTAEVKAHSDICCTSGNAVEVVRSLGEEEVIFVPDQYLGSYVEEQLQRRLILWNGYCNIHTRFLPEAVREAKKKHPDALLMVHPECPPQIRQLADYTGSTSKMLAFPITTDANEFLVATEVGILHQLKKKYPHKRFYPAEEKAVCPNMKKTTLEKLLWCLEDEKEEILIQEEIRQKAQACIQAMFSLR
ncbi:MAG: quinolinate synthase NadA [Syntrophales bacterium LBB04]|nr:quinolinate synthase NadA [Syntrophales bacterium LBB04]